MPKANEVAIELRKMADALDQHADTEVTRPTLSFFYSFGDSKELFLANARILPHPVEKKYPKDAYRYSRVSVDHNTEALSVSVSIYRETVCRLVKPALPAEYECDLTLSESEDAALVTA
jgi:hypothetical protein